MPSLGEINISIDNYHDAITVTILDVIADQAKYPRLIFVAEYVLAETNRTNNPLRDYEMIDICGELRLSERSDTIGTFVWIGQRHQYSSGMPSRGRRINLYCDLDPWRIEKIEKHRDGKEPTFWIELCPTLIGPGPFQNIQTRPTRITIPRDKWIKILEGIGYGDFEIVEITRGEIDKELYSRPISHLKDAQSRLNHGDYDGCLLSCRKAIEAMEKAMPKGKGKLEETIKTTLAAILGEKRGDHLYGIISRVKKWTNIAAHSQGAPVKHSRSEVEFLLNSTTNILYLISGLVNCSWDKC